MKSYIIQQPNAIKQIERQTHRPGAEEVVVKVTNIGLCGSDIHLYNGTYTGPHEYPIMFGHEWSGVVESVGKNVRGLKPGDKVTGDCSRFCGECDYCQHDKNLCQSIEKYGITIDGASSEYIIRHQKYIYRAPEDIDLSLLCLAEPLAVSKQLLTKITDSIGALQDKEILVFGTGAIGLGAIAILKHSFGCENIDAIDISKTRMNTARRLGARKPDHRHLDIQGGGSGYRDLYDTVYDLIIDTTGKESAFQKAFHLIRPLGTIGCLGMMAQATIPQKLIVLKALKLFGSIGGTGSFPDVIQFIHTHPDVVRELISHQLPIDKTVQALELGQNSDDTVKIVLDF